MSDVTAKLAKEANDKTMQIARLKAENDSLRELVRDVHALGCSGFDCTECPSSFIKRCNDEYSGCEWVFILTDRMRELGVDE